MASVHFPEEKQCYFIVVFVLWEAKPCQGMISERELCTWFKEHQKCKIIFSHLIFHHPDAQSFLVCFLKIKNIKRWSLSKSRSIFSQKLHTTFYKYQNSRAILKFKWSYGRTCWRLNFFILHLLSLQKQCRVYRETLGILFQDLSVGFHCCFTESCLHWGCS